MIINEDVVECVYGVYNVSDRRMSYSMGYNTLYMYILYRERDDFPSI